jgi:NAD(P)-dependent dehydrogenase (short-subunit alcohol dehydrogenase family)
MCQWAGNNVAEDSMASGKGLDGILNNKAVVITGAGSGIGRACAVLAAKYGAKVIVNDINRKGATDTANEIMAFGGRAVANFDSVSSWAGSKAIIESCVGEFGRIDGLLNNAALAHVGQPWVESEQEIRALVEVNVLGVLYCGRHALEHMQRQKSGSVVNVASSAVWGINHMPTYAATKGAVTSAGWSWAVDLQPYNVSINTISPQATTIMVKENWQQAFRTLGFTGPTENRTELRTPSAKNLGPGGKSYGPDNVAPLVVYLLSQPKGVTGQYLQIHGRRLSLYKKGENHLNPIGGVTVENETWSVENVSDAFEGTFQKQLQIVNDYTKP